MVSNTEYLIIVLIAVAISLLAVLAKYRNKKIRGDWLIAGLAIGILSPIIGLSMGGFFLNFLFPDGPFAQFFLGLLIFIFSCIGYKYIKKESFCFLIKLLIFSFAVVIFSDFALILANSSDTGLTVMVEKISLDSKLNGFNDYININVTEKELNDYPALKKAIIECRDLHNCNSNPDNEEWMSIRGFFENKAHESAYLFSVVDERSEADLNKGIFSDALRNGFESRGLQLSENAIISQASYQEVNRWNIADKKHLFDLKDAELEYELEKIEITIGEFKTTQISKLDEIFLAKGFPLFEDYTIVRSPEAWEILNRAVNYEIKKENGDLRVYTEEKLSYEIWKENGKLNIYHPKLYVPYLLNIDGNYYRISELMAD
jgi:hypothetical protein